MGNSSSGQYFAYNFSDIRRILDIPGVTCVDTHQKLYPKSSLETPDKYFLFEGPDGVFTPLMMVCYKKNHLDFKDGFVYEGPIISIELFLKKIGRLDLAEKLRKCKVDFSSIIRT
ncbi:MAG: hypothetical protein JNM27_15475 [Leptospirales bacterium]|nr:hypothetical protein [Leptospirales bacterium]